MALLVIVVALTLAVSAMCSLFEAILFSTRTAALEAARVNGHHRASAERFLKMKKDLAGPTSAILILNTIANTAGATVAGMLAAREVGTWFIPTFSVCLTLGILFASEIIPKTYGAVQWRRLWAVVVWPLTFIETMLRPLVYVTQRVARLLVHRQPVRVDSEQEILAMIRLSGRAGEMTPSEQEMLTMVFAFDDVTAADIMVPAERVVSMKREWSTEESLGVARNARHTRYPLVSAGLADAVGLVHIKDLVGLDGSGDIEDLARPVSTLPGTTPIARLLREMQRSGQHMNLVSDLDGNVVGIITLEDVLGQIVGSLDELETPEVVAEGGGKYAVSGAIPMAVLNRRLGLDVEHASDVDTLSSLMVRRLGRPLEPGDEVDLEGVRADVVDVVGTQATRIRLTLATQLEHSDSQNAPARPDPDRSLPRE